MHRPNLCSASATLQLVVTTLYPANGHKSVHFLVISARSAAQPVNRRECATAGQRGLVHLQPHGALPAHLAQAIQKPRPGVHGQPMRHAVLCDRWCHCHPHLAHPATGAHV